jgi:hypothetical protein
MSDDAPPFPVANRAQIYQDRAKRLREIPAADGSRDPGIQCNERSDRRSWAAMPRFFDEVFAR